MFRLIFTRLFVFLAFLALFSNAHGVLMDEGKPQQRLGDLSSMVEHKSMRVIVAYDQVGFLLIKANLTGCMLRFSINSKSFFQKNILKPSI